MNYENIIKHMNEGHKDSLIALCEKFANASKINEIYLKSVDLSGLDIVYDGNELRVEFPKMATNENLKNTIISLCQSVHKTYDFRAVENEIKEFIDSCGSVNIASVNKNGDVIISYAPFIACNGQYYIYISEVADHFDSINANPNNIEIMFIQDESKASSVILRVRLKYRAKATFVQRGSDCFNAVLDVFEEKNHNASGIKMIRNMSDFHLIKLDFYQGRFVKGFGQAYDINNGVISFAGSNGNPHQFRHK